MNQIRSIHVRKGIERERIPGKEKMMQMKKKTKSISVYGALNEIDFCFLSIFNLQSSSGKENESHCGGWTLLLLH